jgi:outer membrane PBP1 activator LpoA protein
MSWTRYLACSLLWCNIATASEISVLLPLSGSTATAAEQIRNGLLAGYYQEINQPANQHLLIRFYDTTSVSKMDTLVQRIEQAASSKVIGPLLKEHVSEMMSNPPNVPVLALNRVNNTPHSSVWQYALAPEDEFLPLAKLMRQEGIQQIRIIGQNDANSERLRLGFEQAWRSVGGMLTDNYMLTSTANDGFTQSVKKLLAEPASKQVQAFYLASPQSALYIMPLLSFYQRQPLPVYSASTAYDADKSVLERQDLNGLGFCGLPWQITPQKWSVQDSAFSDRLFAFGADAWLLSKHISTHKPLSFSLRTGTLTLNEGQIQRQPLCAKVNHGTAQIFKPTQGTTSGTKSL